MIKWQWCRNLPALHPVTRRTTQLVIRMTEADPKATRLLRSADQTPGLMTDSARSLFRVTCKTSDMSIHSRRNREPNATTITPMTSGTCRTTVLRVIESRVETAQRWKCFDLSTLRVCVTDRADRACWIRELLRVTTRAGRVASFAGQRRLR